MPTRPWRVTVCNVFGLQTCQYGHLGLWEEEFKKCLSGGGVGCADGIIMAVIMVIKYWRMASERGSEVLLIHDA